MESDMEAVPPLLVKTRRSMSIHSLCDPLASSVSTLSDVDSDMTLNASDHMSVDGEHPKLDSLSPSEEQAVRALEDLRADTTMSSASPTQNQQDFLNRMQNYSIVNTAVKAWDQGKNYNRALKWGGEMVESVVGGVVQRLEPLEPFANRQLDRFESYRYPSPSTTTNEKSPNTTTLPPPATTTAPSPPPSATSSRWQTVLISTGGLTASISEQSLTSLIFCLRYLRIATTHLTTSITNLQSLLSQSKHHSPHISDEENQNQASTSIGSRIERIKQDIVDTLRKAVDIVSKHAGSALPEPARHRVKLYILSLPSRWAAANNTTTAQSPRPENGSAMNGMTREEETGWKVLTLASESLEMLKGVMNVVGDTLQSAEEWAGRFGRNKWSTSTGSDAQDPLQTKEKDPADSMHIEGQ